MGWFQNVARHGYGNTQDFWRKYPGRSLAILSTSLVFLGVLIVGALPHKGTTPSRALRVSLTEEFHSLPLDDDGRKTTVRLRAELEGMQVGEIWPRVEELLLESLNLRLEDFEFRWVHAPSKVDAAVLKEGEWQGYPPYHPAPDSEDEFRLLVDTPYHDLPLFGQKSAVNDELDTPCPTILVTAGTRDTPSDVEPRAPFNRKVFAATQGYCYLHLRCVTGGPQKADERRTDLYPENITTYAEEIWNEVPKVGTDGSVPQPHLPRVSPFCTAHIDPYFLKFVALLKLWKEAPIETTHILYLDEDVMVTSPDFSIEAWLEELLPNIPHSSSLENPSRPIYTEIGDIYEGLAAADNGRLLQEVESKVVSTTATHESKKLWVREDLDGEDSLLLIGSDFLTFLTTPLNSFPTMTIPLNTGFIYWRRSESLLPMILFADTLSIFVRDRDLGIESQIKYWDTDQGIFTFLLDREFGLSPKVLRDGLSCETEHLIHFNQRLPLWTGAQQSNTGDFRVAILPQRLTAAVPRKPFLSNRGRPDLSWNAGDWMVHLYPGMPRFKARGWKIICQNPTDQLRKACWNTLREPPDSDETTSAH